LYILLEHTSTSQPFLPYRMLKYMISIMDSYLKTAQDKEDLKLPLIYPLILYNGKTRYSHSLDLFDLFEKRDKELAKETLLSPCHLIDLTQVSDEELQKFIWFGSMALALKHIHDSDILPFLQNILKLVEELEKYDANSYIYSIMVYIAKAGKIPHEERWMKTIQSLESADQENIMTLMNLLEKLQPHLEQKMMEKGIEKGIAQGIAKGEHKRELEIAKALLTQGVALDTIVAATNLPKEDIKRLLS
jgi:predicted transposase/invertase (TIGR01784 family)